MYPVYIIFSIFDTFMYTHTYLTLYRNETGSCSNTADIFVKSVCHYIKYTFVLKKEKRQTTTCFTLSAELYHAFNASIPMNVNAPF